MYNLTALQNLYVLIFLYWAPLYLAELFSYRFVSEQLHEHIFNLRQQSFHSKPGKKQMILAGVRVFPCLFVLAMKREIFSSQKQDIEKLSPAYLERIFFNNSLYNKPLTKLRYLCHKRKSFPSDEIIGSDIKDFCRLCIFLIFSCSIILVYDISRPFK